MTEDDEKLLIIDEDYNEFLMQANRDMAIGNYNGYYQNTLLYLGSINVEILTSNFLLLNYEFFFYYVIFFQASLSIDRFTYDMQA